MIAVLEQEEDINQVTAYFSYEHFYVIYCKFWELDRDHDLFIDKMDLTRHNDHGEKACLALQYLVIRTLCIRYIYARAHRISLNFKTLGPINYWK